jgi:hypothetical protein
VLVRRAKRLVLRTPRVEIIPYAQFDPGQVAIKRSIMTITTPPTAC